MNKKRNRNPDFVNMDFGFLDVIEFSHYNTEKNKDKKDKRRLKIYRCFCNACKKEIFLSGSALRDNKYRRYSCGCNEARILKRFEELKQKKFGRLKVLSYAGVRIGESGHSQSMWKCKCDCGIIKNISLSSLNTNKAKSCGCYHLEQFAIQRKKNVKKWLIDIENSNYGNWKILDCISRGKKEGNSKYKCVCLKCQRMVIQTKAQIVYRKNSFCNICNKSYLSVNGIYTSKPQRNLHKLLGFGILNFKTKDRKCVDIAFRKNNQKIAIEYNGQCFHTAKEIKERTQLLNKNGWKVLNINSGGNLIPKKYQVLGTLNRMVQINSMSTTIFLDDWNFKESEVYRPFEKVKT